MVWYGVGDGGHAYRQMYRRECMQMYKRECMQTQSYNGTGNGDGGYGL